MTNPQPEQDLQSQIAEKELELFIHRYQLSNRQETELRDIIGLLIAAEQKRLVEHVKTDVIGANIEHRDYCDFKSGGPYSNPEDLACSCDSDGINETKAEQRQALTKLTNEIAEDEPE